MAFLKSVGGVWEVLGGPLAGSWGGIELPWRPEASLVVLVLFLELVIPFCLGRKFALGTSTFLFRFVQDGVSNSSFGSYVVFFLWIVFEECSSQTSEVNRK